MRMPARLLLLLLPAASRGAKFDMEGQCAKLFHSQKWLDEDELHNWDYKIRVEPWTVFAHVTVKLHGIGMKVENIYGGTGKVGGSSVTVELNAVGGAGVFASSNAAPIRTRNTPASADKRAFSACAQGATIASRSRGRASRRPTRSSRAAACSPTPSARAATSASPFTSCR